MFTCALLAATLAPLLSTAAGQVNQPKNIEALKDQQPAIVQAASDGNNYLLEDLLKQDGTDINVVGLQGFSALHMAAHNGYPDIVHMLIKAGASVNLQKGLRKPGFENVAGWAPMHWAAKNNHATIVRLLVAAGAKVDAEAAANYHFGTPLHVAAGSNDRTEALEALVSPSPLHCRRPRAACARAGPSRIALQHALPPPPLLLLAAEGRRRRGRPRRRGQQPVALRDFPRRCRCVPVTAPIRRRPDCEQQPPAVAAHHGDGRIAASRTCEAAGGGGAAICRTDPGLCGGDLREGGLARTGLRPVSAEPFLRLCLHLCRRLRLRLRLHLLSLSHFDFITLGSFSCWAPVLLGCWAVGLFSCRSR